MSWGTCDRCKKDDGYSDANPFVEIRQRRPSDPADMTCVLAGHNNCVGTGSIAKLPSISTGGGTATPGQWEAWISDEGFKAGFLWLG